MSKRKTNFERYNTIKKEKCMVCGTTKNLMHVDTDADTTEVMCETCHDKAIDEHIKKQNTQAKALCPFVYGGEQCGVNKFSLVPKKILKQFSACEKTMADCNARGNVARFGGLQPEDQPAAEPEKKEQPAPAKPEDNIPPEFYNYRAALKKHLMEKDSLEYSISSLKTQLKAVEKRIEDMNKQFANGDYTGELFSQEKGKVNESAQPTGKPFKREDGPDYDDFLILAGEVFSGYQKQIESRGLVTDDILPAALYDFVTSNPDSATAHLLYSKIEFFKDEDGEFDTVEIPQIDDRTDFQASFVTACDNEKFLTYVEKWTKIVNEQDNDATADAGESEE